MFENIYYVCFVKEINTYKLLHVHDQTLFHQYKCFQTPKLGDSIKSLVAEVLVNSSRRCCLKLSVETRLLYGYLHTIAIYLISIMFENDVRSIYGFISKLYNKYSKSKAVKVNIREFMKSSQSALIFMLKADIVTS